MSNTMNYRTAYTSMEYRQKGKLVLYFVRILNRKIQVGTELGTLDARLNTSYLQCLAMINPNTLTH